MTLFGKQGLPAIEGKSFRFRVFPYFLLPRLLIAKLDRGQFRKTDSGADRTRHALHFTTREEHGRERRDDQLSSNEGKIPIPRSTFFLTGKRNDYKVIMEIDSPSAFSSSRENTHHEVDKLISSRLILSFFFFLFFSLRRTMHNRRNDETRRVKQGFVH